MSTLGSVADARDVRCSRAAVEDLAATGRAARISSLPPVDPGHQGEVVIAALTKAEALDCALVQGTAKISTDIEAVRRWAAVIGGRYMGEDRAEEFGRRNGVPGELLVIVTPTRITAARDISG